jgi:hypothetical protein
VDVPVNKERLPLVIRVGRQELNYGDSSLLAIRELNVRREFDGIKLLFRPDGWSVDAFAMRPVTIRPWDVTSSEWAARIWAGAARLRAAPMNWTLATSHGGAHPLPLQDLL